MDKPESKSKVPAQLSPKSNNKHHCALAPQGLRVHALKHSWRIDIWRWCTDVSIILWNSFCKAVYAWNGHLPYQDCPYPLSLVVDPWRIGGILTSGDAVKMSVSSFGITFVKQSLPEMVRIGGILTSGDGDLVWSWYLSRWNTILPVRKWPLHTWPWFAKS